MVAFVPNLQEANSPQYIGYSKALSRYDVGEDKTAATTIGGITSVFKDAVTGTDNTFKAVIDQAIQGSVDTEREGMTGALEGIAGVPQANRVASTQPDMGAGDQSLTGTLQNIPAAVDKGLANASNLVSAAGNGKLNPSYYEGRLDLVAKDLRSQYPGYREYIDQKMSEMTGGNPANKYMQELLQQINQGIQNRLTEKEKNLSYVRENSGLPDAAVAAQKVQAGQWGTPEVVQWASGYKAVEAKAAVMKAGLDIKKGGLEDKQIDARQGLNALGDDVINHGLVTFNSAIGGELSFDKVPGLFNQIASGQVPTPNENEARAMTQSLSAFRETKRQELLSYASKSGADKYLKPEEIQAWADSKLKPIDAMVAHVTNKEYGAAYTDHNIINGITDSTGVKLMTSQNKDVAAYFQVSGALNKIGGPQVGTMLVRGAVAKGLPADMLAIVGTNSMAIASQESAGGTQPTTLKAAVEQMQKGNIGQPDPLTPNAPGPKQQRKAYGALMELPNNLRDPNIPDAVKLNIIKGSYGPANIGLMGKFEDDKVVNGQLIPGQHSFFNGMTSPATIDKIWELNKSYSGAWDSAKRWTETEHAGMFTNDIKSLGNLAEQEQMYKVAYNSNTHEFSLQPNDQYTGPGRAFDRFTYGQGGPYEFTIAKINSSLKNMSYIAQKEGNDPNAYILHTLKGAGVDPENPFAKAVLTATGKKSDVTPELEQIPGETDKTLLHATIGKAENGGVENYDALFGTQSSAKLTQMTVGEVMALQKHHTDQGSPSSAAGNYQFLRGTLASLVKEGKVNPNDRFDQDTQDRLATALMERRGLNDFKSGKITKEQFANNLAKEWASLPTTAGQSYYEGDGLNHSQVKLPQVIASLGKL